MSYQKRVDKKGDPIICACCSFEGRVELFQSHRTSRGLEDFYLCEICAQTHLAIAYTYPEQCHDSNLYKSIAVLGNIILEELRN